MKPMKSDEEIIALVEAMWAKNKMLTRNLIIKTIGVSGERLQTMHDKGLIKFPPKTIKSNRAAYIRNDKWRTFKLPGSLGGV